MQLFRTLFINLIFTVGFTGSLLAELKYNPATCRYYSDPATPNINQNEYHQFVWACKDILRRYAQEHAALLARYPGVMGSSAYDPQNKAGKVAVVEYLQRLATPISIRLLNDLQQINFNF